MKPSRKVLLYAAYIIGITILFLYVLFPSDTVTAYLAYRLNGADPDFNVVIRRAGPVLPPGIKLYDVSLSHQEAALIGLDNLTIKPGLLSLFTDKTRIKFKGSLYDGQLSGRVELNDSQQASQVKIDGEISGTQLQKIAGLRQLSDHKIAGLLAVNFSYTTSGPNRELTAKLTLSDGRVELATPVFGLKSLDFNNMDADLEVKNERLRIKQCSLKGNQLDASIAGTIALNNVNSPNAINLTGTMKPHHVLLAKIEKSLPANFLGKMKAGKEGISFRIGGTLDEPSVALR